MLLAAASLLVVRLPGTSESLPPGVQEPPYFSGPERPDVPGYTPVGTDLGRQGFVHWVARDEYFRYLFVIRCDEREDVTVRNSGGGDPAVVRCRTSVGDHYEGALMVPPEQAQVLFALSAGDVNVRVERSSPGLPDLHLLQARAPERLSDSDSSGYLVDGRRTPVGTRVDYAISPPQSDDPPSGVYGFGLLVECVAGVHLTFWVAQGELGGVIGDPTSHADNPSLGLDRGKIAFSVSGDTMRRFGLTYGQRVRLTVVRSGMQTDKWRVSAVG